MLRPARTLLRVLGWFVPYWRKAGRLVAVLLGLTVLGIATRTLYPLIFKFIIDHLDPSSIAGEPGSARWWIIVLLGVGFVREITQCLLPATRNWLNQVNSLNMRMFHAGTVFRKKHGFFAKFQAGDLLARLTDDLDQMDKLGWYSGSGVLRPIEAILTLAFSLSVMFSLHWKLALAAVLPLPIGVWIISRTETVQHRRYQERQKRTSETVEALESALSGIRIVVGYAMEGAQKRLVGEALTRREEAEKSVVVLQALLEGIFAIVNQGGLVVVLFFGGWLVLKDPGFSLGDFYAFVAYLSGLAMPLWTISWFFVSTKVADTSIGRLEELETEPERVPGKKTLDKRHPSLELDRVAFSYEGKPPVLSAVSVMVRPGETVALVGPVGCGKTTLLDCAVGLLEPAQGRVLLGGLPLSELTDEERSRRMAYSPQEPQLFSGSVSENVTLGREWVSEEAVRRAFLTAHLTGELEPEGNVSQSGKDLSGGQRGRVSIARSVAGKPEVLVLDDVTSALDARTERGFWDRLRQDLPDAAILVSTHREATAQRAGRVLWLEKGVILHEGTHQELLRESGYRRLFAKEDLPEPGPGLK